MHGRDGEKKKKLWCMGMGMAKGKLMVWFWSVRARGPCSMGHGSGNPGQQTLTLVPFLAKKT
jgi:hypothetical protein